MTSSGTQLHVFGYLGTFWYGNRNTVPKRDIETRNLQKISSKSEDELIQKANRKSKQIQQNNIDIRSIQAKEHSFYTSSSVF